jgi:peroxiredoxin
MEWMKKARAWVNATRPRRIASDVLVVALIFAGASAWQTRALLPGGRPAPDFTLTDLAGAPHQLAELHGKKVLLVFWAPWCGVCASDTEAINAVARAAGDRYTVLSVALSWDSRADVERFAREHDLRYPVLLGDDAVARSFAVAAFPTAYVIDEDGRVEHALVGYTTELGLRLRLL